MTYYVIELGGLRIKGRNRPSLVIEKSFRKSFLVILSKNRLSCEPLGLIERCLPDSYDSDYLLEVWKHNIRFRLVNYWTSEEDYVPDKLWFFISPIIFAKLDRRKLTLKVLYNYVREKEKLIGFTTTIAIL